MKKIQDDDAECVAAKLFMCAKSAMFIYIRIVFPNFMNKKMFYLYFM
jgi:hypothetical protein